jgi:hypothetical protein
MRLDAVDDVEASSSVGPNSSPDVLLPIYSDLPDNIPFLQLDTDTIHDDDENDPSFYPTHKRQYAERLSDEQKVLDILQYIQTRFRGRFSLRDFLHTLFTSDVGSITNTSNVFLADGGDIHLMDIWWGNRWEKRGLKSQTMYKWAVEKAAAVCAKECGWLTDNASKGPHFEDAQFLRVSSKQVTIEMLNTFRIQDLAERYERVTPYLQHILKIIIGEKEGVPKSKRSRNPDYVSLSAGFLILYPVLTCNCRAAP